MEVVVKKINMKLDWKLFEFSGLMGEFQIGKFDIILNQVVVMGECKKMYNFIELYFYVGI